MTRQALAQAIFTNGTTTSSTVNFEGYRTFTLEVPSGDAAVAVTVQMLSGDGSTWIDAQVLADTTNQIKGLAVLEEIKLAPLKMIRLKVGSGVSGTKTYYLHMST